MEKMMETGRMVKEGLPEMEGGSRKIQMDRVEQIEADIYRVREEWKEEKCEVGKDCNENVGMLKRK